MSDDTLSEIKQDIKEVKGHLLELIKQGAVQQKILETHERRSTNLEDRFKPVEDDLVFRRKIFTVTTQLAGMSGVFGVVFKVISLYLQSRQ